MNMNFEKVNIQFTQEQLETLDFSKHNVSLVLLETNKKQIVFVSGKTPDNLYVIPTECGKPELLNEKELIDIASNCICLTTLTDLNPYEVLSFLESRTIELEYEKFKGIFIDFFSSIVCTYYDDVTIKVLCPPEVVFDSVLYSAKDTSASPMIYIKNEYDYFCEHRLSLFDYFYDFNAKFKGYVSKAANFKMSNFSNMDLSKVYPILVGTECSRYKKDAITIDFLDMKIQFRYDVEINKDEVFSVVLSDSYLESVGVTKEEMMENAYNNVKDSYEYGDLESLVKSKLNTSLEMPEGCLYYMSNRSSNLGAYAIVAGVHKKLSQELNANLYLIPSSVHEWLVLDANEHDYDIAYLKETIHFVNSDCVPNSDKLSDNLYYYDKELDEIKII